MPDRNLDRGRHCPDYPLIPKEDAPAASWGIFYFLANASHSDISCVVLKKEKIFFFLFLEMTTQPQRPLKNPPFGGIFSGARDRGRRFATRHFRRRSEKSCKQVFLPFLKMVHLAQPLFQRPLKNPPFGEFFSGARDRG